MNAYEVAKELSNFMTEDGYTDLDKAIFMASNMLRQQADRIAELENAKQFIQNFAEEQHRRACALEEFQTKPLSDEEIYALWCEADNTELLPEMRLKDGSINYIITTFAKLIEERHGIK